MDLLQPNLYREIQEFISNKNVTEVIFSIPESTKFSYYGRFEDVTKDSDYSFELVEEECIPDDFLLHLNNNKNLNLNSNVTFKHNNRIFTKILSYHIKENKLFVDLGE